MTAPDTRDVDAHGNCGRCGGVHYGSGSMCVYEAPPPRPGHHTTITSGRHGTGGYWWACSCGDEGGPCDSYNEACDATVDHEREEARCTITEALAASAATPATNPSTTSTAASLVAGATSDAGASGVAGSNTRSFLTDTWPEAERLVGGSDLFWDIYPHIRDEIIGRVAAALTASRADGERMRAEADDARRALVLAEHTVTTLIAQRDDAAGEVAQERDDKLRLDEIRVGLIDTIRAREIVLAAALRLLRGAHEMADTGAFVGDNQNRWLVSVAAFLAAQGGA